MVRPSLIGIACLILMAVACTRPHYGLDSTAKDKFASLPGSLELEILQFESRREQKLMTYAIANGELSLKTTKTCVWPDVDACYFGYSKQYIHSPDTARFYEKTPVTIPKGLPLMKGYQYIGPFSLSPDNSVALFSIASESSEWSTEYPMDIVLIEIGTKEVVFQTNRNNVWFQIKDVVWSPDSKLFAVLYDSFKRYHGPLGIIGSLIGHPQEIHTYYLSIYDRRGSLLMQSRVAYGLVTGWGNIRFSSWRS